MADIHPSDARRAGETVNWRLAQSRVGNTRNKSTHTTDPSPANRTDGEVAW